jgi:ubiquinone/menaquinone biosynthesis C-methylase UbiE
MRGATVMNCWRGFQAPNVARGAVEIQRAYYAETAQNYDEIHSHDRDEHGLGLAYMMAMVEFFGIGSVLDVGSGTGFALLKLKEKMPSIRAVGVEPSEAQRILGHRKGLSETELVDGDAMGLAFADGSFDLVCEFGALHHIPRPELAISEMLRVARKAIFISDSNNFGQGGKFARLTKQVINALGFWPAVNLIKTKGKGYTLTTGDGLSYSYSVFTNYKQISRSCEAVYLLNTGNGKPNLYRTSGHVALLGIIRSKAKTAK